MNLKSKMILTVEQLLKLGLSLEDIKNKDKTYRKKKLLVMESTNDIIKFMTDPFNEDISIDVECYYEIENIVDSSYSDSRRINEIFDEKYYDITLESDKFLIQDKRSTSFCMVYFEIEFSDAIDLIKESTEDDDSIVLVGNLLN